MNRISEYRAKAKLTQSRLAELAGFKGSSRLGNYEAGIREPGLDECRALVSALNSVGIDCTLDDVFPPDQQPDSRKTA